ncbi:MAG TPA: hypothetical protein VHC63_16745 [Acidimicrobiales bacterium]|nr:hypothetical protein [Acidimicrobiales bacterium]
MGTNETWVDAASGRKFFVDAPAAADRRDDLTFVLNLHGGGSVGMWQRLYFPAHDYADEFGLVVATPSAQTKQPMSHWNAEADDEHLRAVVEMVVDRFGDRLRAFWLAGHSQGGMTSNRLLRDPWWADRVDGWLSLSGGRIGTARFVEDFGPPRTEEEREAMAKFMAARRRESGASQPTLHDAEFSFVFAVGEHEIEALPDTSPWPNASGPRPGCASPTSSTPNRARRTTAASRVATSRVGDASRVAARRTCSCIPTRTTAASSPTSCAWTRATPKASSRMSRAGSSSSWSARPAASSAPCAFDDAAPHEHERARQRD